MKTRISIPSKAKKGDILDIKTLVSHPMHSGFRRDAIGELVPRNIIKFFRCEYEGVLVFEAEFGPGTAANPFLSFHFRADKSGKVKFLWIDQDGEETEEVEFLDVVDA
ncbi:MAG: sulfur-oxidizing protein SoxZ, partial [Oceanicoccus sp.]